MQANNITYIKNQDGEIKKVSFNKATKMGWVRGLGVSGFTDNNIKFHKSRFHLRSGYAKGEPAGYLITLENGVSARCGNCCSFILEPKPEHKFIECVDLKDLEVGMKIGFVSDVESLIRPLKHIFLFFEEQEEKQEEEPLKNVVYVPISSIKPIKNFFREYGCDLRTDDADGMLMVLSNGFVVEVPNTDGTLYEDGRL